MATFIHLDSLSFEAWLQSHSFTRSIQNHEVVYCRALSQNNKIVVKIYTSIRDGDSIARDVGKDAIRVVAIFTGPSGKVYPLYRGKRIHRTGSQAAIQERVLERLTEATHRCEEWNVANKLTTKAKEDARERDSVMGAKEQHATANVGDEITIVAKITSRKQYGKKFLFVMTRNTSTFTYWSERDVLEVGNEYRITATISKFHTYNGSIQIELINCRGKKL